jgi:hypothetical protein
MSKGWGGGAAGADPALKVNKNSIYCSIFNFRKHDPVTQTGTSTCKMYLCAPKLEGFYINA